LKIDLFLKDISSSSSGQQLMEFRGDQGEGKTGEEEVADCEQTPELPWES
jgi:hypothetical protein